MKWISPRRRDLAGNDAAVALRRGRVRKRGSGASSEAQIAPSDAARHGDAEGDHGVKRGCLPRRRGGDLVARAPADSRAHSSVPIDRKRG